LWSQTSNCSLLLIYRPRKDERLSWPGWLTRTPDRNRSTSINFIHVNSRSLYIINWRIAYKTYSGRFTHVSGHPSAVGRAQDRESSPVKDRRSVVLDCSVHVPSQFVYHLRVSRGRQRQALELRDAHQRPVLDGLQSRARSHRIQHVHRLHTGYVSPHLCTLTQNKMFQRENRYISEMVEYYCTKCSSFV